MNKLKAILTVLFVVGLAACSPKSEDKVPSIKGDFQDQYDFIQASLDTTIQASSKETKLSEDHYQFLMGRLNGILTIIPKSALFSKEQAYDNVSNAGFSVEDWAIRVREISIWSICPQGGVPLKSKVYVSVNGLSFPMDANASTAYGDAGKGFDYDSHNPQYKASYDELIEKKYDSMKMSINWESTTSDSKCYMERVRVKYLGTHEKVIEAVKSFRAEIEAIQSDLRDLRYNSSSAPNYPLQYMLKKQADRLRTAYEKLP